MERCLFGRERRSFRGSFSPSLRGASKNGKGALATGFIGRSGMGFDPCNPWQLSPDIVKENNNKEFYFRYTFGSLIFFFVFCLIVADVPLERQVTFLQVQERERETLNV